MLVAGELHIVSAYCQHSSSQTCFAETGDVNGLLLTKPNEPMEKRHRRIKQLVEDMPAVLKAAEDAEAAAAAAAKASQTELPSPEKVLELLGRLMPHLHIPSFDAITCNLRAHCLTRMQALQAIPGGNCGRMVSGLLSATSMQVPHPPVNKHAIAMTLCAGKGSVRV